MENAKKYKFPEDWSKLRSKIRLLRQSPIKHLEQSKEIQ